MSAESSHRTLDEFARTESNPDKTYTAQNVRSWTENRRATARRDWVASMLRKFPEACDVYHTKMTPYRYEPQHAQQDQKIENHREETGDPGIPLNSEKFAEKLTDGIADYDCRVILKDTYEDGIQTISVSGGTKSYEIHVDTSVVKWVAP